MTHYIHTKLGDDRRVAIPIKVCNRLGIEEHDSLRLVPSAVRLGDVQAAFAPYRTEGESGVDELIADRRAEAAREIARG